jgi:CAAX protease family protein
VNSVVEGTPPEINTPKRPVRRRWGPWSTLAWGVGIAIVMVLAQTGGAIGYLTLTGKVLTIQREDLASDGPLLATSLLAATPAVLGFIVFAVKLSRVPLTDYLALKWPRWREFGWGVGALVLVLFAAGIASEISGQETPEFMADTFRSAREAGLLPLVLISFVILGPLQEELVFRGFLYRGFAPAFGAAPAIVLTSALWAVIHVQYKWFFVAEIFALGLAFGWARWKSGSTILPFLLHAMVNGAALLSVAVQ